MVGKRPPSPRPSPPRLIIAHKSEPFFGQSRRDCVLQPRVARASQPWALGRNPVGIHGNSLGLVRNDKPPGRGCAGGAFARCRATAALAHASNAERRAGWAKAASAFPLPGGEGWGEGEPGHESVGNTRRCRSLWRGHLAVAATLVNHDEKMRPSRGPMTLKACATSANPLNASPTMEQPMHLRSTHAARPA